MRGTVLYGARDVRYEEVPEPHLQLLRKVHKRSRLVGASRADVRGVHANFPPSFCNVMTDKQMTIC
jgi:hypothetical protein